jgi:hypothetical protein
MAEYFDHRDWLAVLQDLAHDAVVGVRIGVSRLVGTICGMSCIQLHHALLRVCGRETILEPL